MLDEDGNDLLDPNKQYEKSIDLNNIKLIQLIDGKEVVYIQPNLDGPRGYQLFLPETGENEDKYKLAVAVNVSSSNTITHI